MIKIKPKTKPFATNVKFSLPEDIKNYNKLAKIKGRYSINDVVLIAISEYVNKKVKL